MRFSSFDKLKALAVVRVFETSKPFGDYAACAVLNDGAGVSYGISQFTHRSGSLAEVVEKYLGSGGAVGRAMLEDTMHYLKRRDRAAIEAVAGDERFKKALRAAAITREMREAQELVAFERYLKPAIDACEGSGFVLPLSLAVVCDSMTHGSWEKIRDRVSVQQSLFGHQQESEKAWITEYVRQRHAWLGSIPRLAATRYRTKFFLDQIATGRWELELPLNVHGVKLTEKLFSKSAELANREVENPLAAPTTPASQRLGHPSLPRPESGHPSSNQEGSWRGTAEDSIGPASHGNKTTYDPPHTLPGPSQEDGRREAVPADEGQARSKPQVEEQRSGGVGEMVLESVENRVTSAAEKYDRVERVVNSVITRKDSAKSLWTTVAGTVWQTAWAVFGFLSGMPREVWLVAAVIAGVLMLLYLYRQIELGRIRESSGSGS